MESGSKNLIAKGGITFVISGRRAFSERVEIHLNRSQEKARQFKPIDSMGWIMAKDRYLPFPHEIMMFSCYMGFGWHIWA